MGLCKYCAKSVSWFSNEHDECKKKHDEGKSKLASLLLSCFSQKQDFYLKSKDFNTIVDRSYIDVKVKEDVFVEVFDKMIEQYLNDGVIDEDEKKIIARFIQFSEISKETLNRNRSLEKYIQAQVLQNIFNGNNTNPLLVVNGDFPFMLEKGESLIWLFRDVTLYENKIKKEYAGRSHGINIRIARGVYYRTGIFKGTPIETSYMCKVSTGSVCLTNKHIYFSSPEKSFRIPYVKILSVESYSNGIGLQKDASNAKPIFLENVSPWFCYNVISNLRD